MMDKRTAEMDGAGFEAIKLRYASFTPPFQTLWLDFSIKSTDSPGIFVKTSVILAKKRKFSLLKTEFKAKKCLQKFGTANSV